MVESIIGCDQSDGGGNYHIGRKVDLTVENYCAGFCGPGGIEAGGGLPKSTMEVFGTGTLRFGCDKATSFHNLTAKTPRKKALNPKY